MKEIQELPDLEVLSPIFPGQRKLSDNNQLPIEEASNIPNQEGSNKQLIELQKCSTQEVITLKRSKSGKNLETDKLEEFKNLISNQISQTPIIQPKVFEKDSVKPKINLSMNKNPEQAQANKPVKQQSNTSSMLRLRKPGMTVKQLDIEINVKSKEKGIINQSKTTKKSNSVFLKQQ